MIRNLARPMRILMPASILSALAMVVLLLLRREPGEALAFAVAGLLLFLGVLLVTLLVNVPIDNEIKRWTPRDVPDNWTEIRDRWQTFHTVRTFASLAGLACALASVLVF